MRLSWPHDIDPSRETDCAISQLARAGLPSVAIRVPAHPIAQTLLSKLGPSGRLGQPVRWISPTTMDHVIVGLDGRIDAVVDGERADGCESTIISLLMIQ